MPKQPTTVYVCQNCGSQSRKWLGQCPDCHEWNTLVEERFRAAPVGRASARPFSAEPLAFAEIESQDDVRTTCGIPELDRVLGGGVVAGSLVLIGGAPGIGKSTIVLQVADRMASDSRGVLYVSGEESARQVKMRGERLGLGREGLFILAETDLRSILAEAERSRPALMIIASIQTIYSDNVESAPGSVSQVREPIYTRSVERWKKYGEAVQPLVDRLAQVDY